MIIKQHGASFAHGYQYKINLYLFKQQFGE